MGQLKIILLMKQSGSSDKSNFWKNLDEDIDRIGKKVKENLQKHERNQPILAKPKVTSRHSNRDHKTIPAQDYSHLSLRKKKLEKAQKEQAEEAKSMRNRISYMRNDQSKQYKTIEMAKRKFEQIVEVRNQSMREKKLMKKRREDFLNEDKEAITEKVQEVKSARETKNYSLTSWRRSRGDLAKNIKLESVHNESFIRERKLSFVAENQVKAERTKKDLERSRSIVSEMSERKIEMNRRKRLEGISQQLSVVNSQKKNNQKLFHKLKVETERISKWKSRAHREIDEYQSFLGLKTQMKMEGSRVSNPSSFCSHRTSKSFYLTNI